MPITAWPSRTGTRPSRIRSATTALAVALVALFAATPASAAAATSPQLNFATLNVCNIGCYAPAPPWSVRRDRITRTIAASGADVLSLNEASDLAYGSITQWQDIQNLTGPLGYAAPTIQDDRCKSLGCTHTARLMFRSATVQQVMIPGQSSAGFWRVEDIAPAVPVDGDRQVAWAYLQGLNGTGPFLAISVHLSTQRTAAAEQHRLDFGHAATAWAEGMNAARGLAGAPIVLMGDFNSYDFRQPHGVQRILRDAGWTDAVSAPRRAHLHINSINYTDRQRTGWPTRPIYNKWRLAARIDYIMMRGPVKPLTYAVVVHVNKDGTFDQAYQGSDHLMVRARLQFG
jgi:endonuclease/exonuclease/phosphatase family metal-dependent hydrolase